MVLSFLLVFEVGLFVINVFEARKPRIWRAASFPANKVGPEDVCTRVSIDLLVPLLGESSTFGESLTVSELTFEVVDAMEELASLTVHADTILMELFAQLSLEI